MPHYMLCVTDGKTSACGVDYNYGDQFIKQYGLEDTHYLTFPSQQKRVTYDDALIDTDNTIHLCFRNDRKSEFRYIGIANGERTVVQARDKDNDLPLVVRYKIITKNNDSLLTETDTVFETNDQIGVTKYKRALLQGLEDLQYIPVKATAEYEGIFEIVPIRA